MKGSADHNVSPFLFPGQATAVRQAAPPAPCRVLLVENDPATAHSLRRSLQELGYERVKIAHSAAAALGFLREAGIDLVLLGSNLPDEGHEPELAGQLRERYQLPYVYIVSSPGEHPAIGADVITPYGYLVQPFRPPEVQTVLELARYKHACGRLSRQAQEKDVLLAIGEAVAQVRDRQELFATIFEQIKPMIPVDDTGILILDQTGKYWQGWSTVDNYQETEAATQLQQLGYDQFLPVDRWLEHTMHHTGIMTVAQFREDYPEHPFGPVMWESGLRELMFTPLVNGGKKLGVLLFDAAQEGTYTKEHLELFKAVADLIAVAVANILANEEILQREREKTMLLSLSKDMASIRDKEHLLKMILDRIKPLIPHHDCGLIVIDKEGLYHYDLTVAMPTISPSNCNSYLHQAGLQKVVHPQSLTQKTMALVAQANHPLILTTDELVALDPGYPYLESLKRLGYEEFLCTHLKTRGKIIGLFTLNAIQKNQFSPRQYSLFQAIANQVSVAVANILANEEILEREREKTMLLSISEDIATVRSPTDLLKVINGKIKQLIPFYDTGVLIVEPGGQYHYDIAVTMADWDASEGNQLLQREGHGRIAHPGSFVEHTMHKLEAHGSPMIEDWDQLFQTYEYPFFPVMRKVGYKEALVTNLRSRGKILGTLWLNAMEHNFFEPAQFPLFQSIADQVAVAVANILANEEILEQKADIEAREREKATLLSISGAISSARNAVELLTVIREKARQLIPFYDTGILIVEPDGEHHYDLAVNFPGWDDSEVNRQLQTAKLHRAAHKGSHLAYVMELIAADGPVIEDWEKAFKNFDHPFFPTLQELGYKESIVAVLQSGGKTFGTLWLNSLEKNYFHPKQFEIFQALADQVAVAVANILANEEILEREREKSVLLSISEALATIRDKRHLLQVVFEKVRPLFGFYDTGLFVLDQERHYIEDWSVTLPQVDDSQANLLLRTQGAGKIPFAGSALEWGVEQLRQAGGPVVFPYTEDVINQFPDYAQFSVMKQIGYKESIGALLRTNQGELGILFFNSLSEGHFQENQFVLFQAIADQVAVAVANILANEEILEQKADIEDREREKSLQLVVSTALTSPLPWEEKFRQVLTAVGQLVAWDLCLVGVSDRPTLSMSWQAGPDGSPQLVSFQQLCQKLGVGPAQLREMAQQTGALYAQPSVYAGQDFAQLRQAFRLVELLARHWQLRAKIDLPLPVQGSPKVLLVLASRRPDAYGQAHLALLQRLQPTMSLALENIFSFEDLARRDAEKTRQLALNRVLVGIRDGQRLYAAIAQELNELVAFDTLSVRVVANGRLQCYVIMHKADGGFVDSTESVKAEVAKIEQLELAEAGLHPPQATIYTGEAFAARCAAQPLYQLRRDRYGVRSAIELPLPMKEGQLAVLVLGSRAAYAFTEEDLAKLSLFIPQVALAIENQLSFEEINALRRRVEQEKTYLAEEIKVAHNFEEIISTSPLMQRVFRQVSQVAPTDTSVLILGESGTGKELIARALHNHSPRKDRVLVKLNCAALPAQLIESELFGHEKGAFTGAFEKRTGKFELANGGTIFLDEIGEMPLELQSKLLRVLQEKEFERLGSNKVLRTDVRVIAATNRDLQREVAEGRFRMDLYYRLSVFPLQLPPLRERPEDIPLLAVYFAQRFCKRIGKPFRGIGETAMQELLYYGWPGNIRELENLVEQAVILNDGQAPLAWGRSLANPARPVGSPVAVAGNLQLPALSTEARTLTDFDQYHLQVHRDYLLAVLRQTGGRIRGKGGAAEILNVKPTTLESRLKRMGITKEHAILGPE